MRHGRSRLWAEQMSKTPDLWHCIAQLVSAEWPELQVSLHELELTDCGSCEPASACRSTESACTASQEVVAQLMARPPAVTLAPKLADLRMPIAIAHSFAVLYKQLAAPINQAK